MNCEGYTKLSASILTSTVWVEPDQTLRVWITILALCDRNGFVSGTVPGLASVARVAVDACREAVGKFLAPDPDSRTKEHEGRRIESVDGGWFVFNHAKYRDERDPDSRREQTRRAVAKHREKKKLAAASGKPCNPDVSQSKPKKAQAEAEAEAEAEAVKHVPSANVLLESKITLSAMFNRKAGRAFNYAEESMLVELARDPAFPEQLSDITTYRGQLKPEDRRFFPQSISALLAKWSETLDRAHNAEAPPTTRPMDVQEYLAMERRQTSPG